MHTLDMRLVNTTGCNSLQLFERFLTGRQYFFACAIFFINIFCGRPINICSRGGAYEKILALACVYGKIPSRSSFCGIHKPGRKKIMLPQKAALIRLCPELGLGRMKGRPASNSRTIIQYSAGQAFTGFSTSVNRMEQHYG